MIQAESTPAAATGSHQGVAQLRVSMVLPTLVRAGMEVITSRLAVALTAAGHFVEVVCIEATGPLEEELQAAGVPVYRVPTPGVWSNVSAPALATRLAAHRPHIVHTHSGAWLKGARAGRRAGAGAVVHTVHGLLDREPWYSSLLKRVAAAHTDAVVAVSQPLHEYLVHDVRLPASRVRTVPNGVDTHAFTPDVQVSREQVLGRPVRGCVIGCVARFDAVKNHALLVQAFRDVRRTNPQLVLVLVGDGTLRHEIEQQTRDLGISDSVIFTGDRRDTAQLYRCFDIFVLPSFAEGTSISLLEAMASGCCTIATNVGGNGELLGATAGLLVPSADPGAMAAALHRVIADAVLRRSLGRAARERVAARYSVNGMAARYQAIYLEALGAGRSAGPGPDGARGA